MDGRWAVVGSVRVQYPRHPSRRDQPAGAAGPAAADPAGQGDGHLLRAGGAVFPMLR